jgi:hypothetical protein
MHHAIATGNNQRVDLLVCYRHASLCLGFFDAARS